MRFYFNLVVQLLLEAKDEEAKTLRKNSEKILSVLTLVNEISKDLDLVNLVESAEYFDMVKGLAREDNLDLVQLLLEKLGAYHASDHHHNIYCYWARKMFFDTRLKRDFEKRLVGYHKFLPAVF